MKCYASGKTQNMSWECPENKKYEGGEDHISEAHKRNVEEETIEEGMPVMMSKFLIKLEKDEKDLVQRNSMFGTSCKTKDRVCKVIIDSGSIDNLV
jgi:hypothetical protein